MGGAKRGTSQFVVRAGFVRLRGRFGQTDIAIAGCTGGGIVDLLNLAIVEVEPAFIVNILGVGVRAFWPHANNFEMRAARLQNRGITGWVVNLSMVGGLNLMCYDVLQAQLGRPRSGSDKSKINFRIAPESVVGPGDYFSKLISK